MKPLLHGRRMGFPFVRDQFVPCHFGDHPFDQGVQLGIGPRFETRVVACKARDEITRIGQVFGDGRRFDRAANQCLPCGEVRGPQGENFGSGLGGVVPQGPVVRGSEPIQILEERDSTATNRPSCLSWTGWSGRASENILASISLRKSDAGRKI